MTRMGKVSETLGLGHGGAVGELLGASDRGSDKTAASVSQGLQSPGNRRASVAEGRDDR